MINRIIYLVFEAVFSPLWENIRFCVIGEEQKQKQESRQGFEIGFISPQFRKKFHL